MNFSPNNMLRAAALFGVAAVTIGAFGAHGLKPHLTEYQIQIFEKGVQYHFYHTLALGLLGIWSSLHPSRRAMWAAWAFSIGIFMFAGSLYILACKDLIPFNTALAGPITPLGGLCFIAGWVLLFLSVGDRVK